MGKPQIEVTIKLGPADEKTVPLKTMRGRSLGLVHVFTDKPGLERIEYFLQGQVGFYGGIYQDTKGRLAIAEYELQNGRSYHETSQDVDLRVRRYLAGIDPCKSNTMLVRESEQPGVWDEIIMLFPNHEAVNGLLTRKTLEFYGMIIPFTSAKTLIDLVSQVKV